MNEVTSVSIATCLAAVTAAILVARRRALLGDNSQTVAEAIGLVVPLGLRRALASGTDALADGRNALRSFGGVALARAGSLRAGGRVASGGSHGLPMPAAAVPQKPSPEKPPAVVRSNRLDELTRSIVQDLNPQSDSEEQLVRDIISRLSRLGRDVGDGPGDAGTASRGHWQPPVTRSERG